MTEAHSCARDATSTGGKKVAADLLLLLVVVVGEAIEGTNEADAQRLLLLFMLPFF